MYRRMVDRAEPLHKRQIVIIVLRKVGGIQPAQEQYAAIDRDRIEYDRQADQHLNDAAARKAAGKDRDGICRKEADQIVDRILQEEAAQRPCPLGVQHNQRGDSAEKPADRGTKQRCGHIGEIQRAPLLREGMPEVCTAPPHHVGHRMHAEVNAEHQQEDHAKSHRRAHAVLLTQKERLGIVTPCLDLGKAHHQRHSQREKDAEEGDKHMRHTAANDVAEQLRIDKVLRR